VTKAPRRTRRDRADIRIQLLEAAVLEFGEKGFDGASTRSIARKIGAHQPQINYYFAAKEALWAAAVDHLFELLHQAMDGLTDIDPSTMRIDDLAVNFAEMIRRLVRFAAAHPELNQIMVHEGTAAGDRLTWITEKHVRPLYELTRQAWSRLREAGIAAPIADGIIHYVLLGAASLPYVNAAEVRLLTGSEPTGPTWREQHADGLVAALLPGIPAPGSSRSGAFQTPVVDQRSSDGN
jgi:TetR/AcrR family transcriptional regulator